MTSVCSLILWHSASLSPFYSQYAQNRHTGGATTGGYRVEGTPVYNTD